MGICTLVDVLNKLRKSSGESIDSDKSFDRFKQYMHVRRNVEDDLRNVLRNINASNKKTLVMLCGSAGDGKSHMLSYLKNHDEEKLLNDYLIHNDATESSGPNKTAIETLNEVLDDFSDEKLTDPGKNLILAINLGVLNNFIESEYGERFSHLKQYVEEHNILSTKLVDTTNNVDDSIQHVSFADYQLYTLKESGADSQYIKSLLQKIFNADEDNPFYSAYCSGCGTCPMQSKCPVRFNYIFLQNQKVQNYITNLLIMTIIKKKDILTTREILNYFYDITVQQDFNYSALGKLLADDSGIIKKFMIGMTPNLMFEQVGVSILMDHVRENDPVLFRDEASDDFAVEYYVSTDISVQIREVLGNTSYREFILNPNVLQIINAYREIKGSMFSCLIRLGAMQDNVVRDSCYEQYIKNLYYYNSGQKKNLKNLYSSVYRSVLQWCGTDGDGHVCLDQNNTRYSLYEDLKFESDLSCVPKQLQVEELNRFIPELKVGFVNKDNKVLLQLNIDFPLYRLIQRLNNGYIHTVNDANNHADFIGFIERMLKAGNSMNEVYIAGNGGNKSVLKLTEFGYEFEVIK